MAQAATATANTDELLSQLASSEIDRLLAEADGNPAPAEKKPAKGSAPVTTFENAAPSPDAIPEGNERAALLQAAGFDSKEIAPPAPAVPHEDERSALLQAAGFESSEELPDQPKPRNNATHKKELRPIPVFLKPLVWINAPLDDYPEVVRQVMGKVGIVTLLNALAVLTYVIFFRKH
jgi:hypothetical protein